MRLNKRLAAIDNSNNSLAGFLIKSDALEGALPLSRLSESTNDSIVHSSKISLHKKKKKHKQAQNQKKKKLVIERVIVDHYKQHVQPENQNQNDSPFSYVRIGIVPLQTIASYLDPVSLHNLFATAKIFSKRLLQIDQQTNSPEFISQMRTRMAVDYELNFEKEDDDFYEKNYYLEDDTSDYYDDDYEDYYEDGCHACRIGIHRSCVCGGGARYDDI